MSIFENLPYEYIDTQSRLETICKSKLSKEDVLAVDTEGTSLDPYSNRLLLLQVATKDKAFVIDTQKVKDLSSLKRILENPSQLKLVQNGKFDYKALKVSSGIELRNMFDTMLAEALLIAGLGNMRGQSLEALADKYLGVKLKKEIRKTFNHVSAITKDQLEYAAVDVLVLFPIFKAQVPEIRKKSLTKVAKLEFKVIPVVGEMELRGLCIDVKKWRKHMAKIKEKRDQIAKQIQREIRPLYSNSQEDLFGNMSDVVNLNSQKQLMELLNDKLGLNVPSTGVNVLEKVNHPIARMLLEYRGYEKLLSSFGEGLLSKINKHTGRLHPDFQQLGAATGRFSCTNPNLQQIPRGEEFRSCFVAAKGYKLINADYSQAELRILADYSKDAALIKAYREGKDLHTFTASQMYGVPMDKVTKDMRQATKTINFGLMYGRGPASIGAQIGVSAEEARKLLDKYFGTYSGVKRWLEKTGEEVLKRGYVETKLGRKRWFRKPDKANPAYNREVASIVRAAKNHPIQGTNADMTKLSLIFIYERFKKEGIDGGIVHTVHDEIVSEVKEEQANAAAKIQEEEMERAGRLLLKSVPVVAEALVSDIWEH